MVNRAFYGNEVTVLTKHGKDLAAVVPIDLLNSRDPAVPKKRPQRSK